MPRSVRSCLTVCASALAASAAVSVLLAPSASAGPVMPSLPAHIGATHSTAPGVMSGVPPFGRRLG